jgi:hypothetical protein
VKVLTRMIEDPASAALRAQVSMVAGGLSSILDASGFEERLAAAATEAAQSMDVVFGK